MRGEVGSVHSSLPLWQVQARAELAWDSDRGAEGG